MCYICDFQSELIHNEICCMSLNIETYFSGIKRVWDITFYSKPTKIHYTTSYTAATATNNKRGAGLILLQQYATAYSAAALLRKVLHYIVGRGGVLSYRGAVLSYQRGSLITQMQRPASLQHRERIARRCYRVHCAGATLCRCYQLRKLLCVGSNNNRFPHPGCNFH